MVLGMVDSRGTFSHLVRIILHSLHVYSTFNYDTSMLKTSLDLEVSDYEYKGSHPGLSNSVLRDN
jgi:hypothetical protein